MLVPAKHPGRPAGAILLACALTLTFSGCGAGTGDVSGKVTHKHKALVFGTVMIVGSDGLPRYGEITEEGTYWVAGVPCGQVHIAVNSPDPTTPLFSKDESKGPRTRPPEEAKRLAALKSKWFALPDKYGDPNTSALTLAVHRGLNTQDIDLK